METQCETKIDYEGKVKTIIAYKLNVDEKKITPQSSFTENLDADFLDIVDMVMEFEDVFNISIPADQIEKISTVSEAIESVRKNGRQSMLNKLMQLSLTSIPENKAILNKHS